MEGWNLNIAFMILEQRFDHVRIFSHQSFELPDLFVLSREHKKDRRLPAGKYDRLEIFRVNVGVIRGFAFYEFNLHDTPRTGPKVLLLSFSFDKGVSCPRGSKMGEGGNPKFIITGNGWHG